MAISIDESVQDPAPDTVRRRRSLTALCAQYRWRTIGASLLVLAGGLALLSGGLTTMTDGEELVGDSARAVEITSAVDFGDRPTERVVLVSDEPLAETAVADLTRQARSEYTGLDGVAEVGEPVLSADRRTLVVPVTLDAAWADDESSDGAAADRLPEDAVPAMLAATEDWAAQHPDLSIGQVGPGSIDREVGEAMDDDLRRAEIFSLPITLAVLLIAFGSVVAAGVPVLLGVAAVATAMGITALVSRTLVPVSDVTASLVLLIGLAVGVDYALFIVRRAREERAAGASPRESVVRAGATAGRAVVISGITVAVAMSGMIVAGGLFASLAIGAMIVVAVAVLASATVLPAILSLLGDRVDAWRLPGTRRRALRRGSEATFWGRLASRVVRRPLAWTLVAAAALAALAMPALGMRTGLPGQEAFPDSFDTVHAYRQLIAAFPQDGTTVDVVVRAPASAQDEVREALEGAFPAARATGEVIGEPDFSASIDGTVTVMALGIPHDESDPEVAQAAAAVREQVVPQVRSALTDVDGAPSVAVHVAGAAVGSDLVDWMNDRLPWVVGFVLLLTFLVMLVSFGSPWLALATVGLNTLSVAAAYGVVSLVFQNTWAEGLLDFDSIGLTVAWLPTMLFVMLFGLSMDYHVFVVSRVREAWSQGSSAAEAVRLGVTRSAAVVTSAAAVMVGVFAIFGTLSSLEMKQLGVGLATAILLDATVVRGVLLPGVLTLLGARAHTRPRWLPVLHH